MTTPALIISSVLILLLITGNIVLVHITKKVCKVNTPEKAEKIYVPVEPMFEQFCSISDDIDNAYDKDALYAAYVRLIIFTSIYDDSPAFVSDLHDMYIERETLLLNPKS